jgi:hypothetical protein
MKIEDYKGFQISYNETSDKFYADIELGDNVKNAKRQSLVKLRKDIDKFIRDNAEFKPMRVLYRRWSDLMEHTIESLRSDGKFVLNKKGSNSREYITPSEMIGKTFKFDSDYVELVERQEQELDELRNRHKIEITAAQSKLEPLDLSMYDINGN